MSTFFSGKMLYATLFLTAFGSLQVLAQSFFPPTPVSFKINKSTLNYSQKVRVNEFVKQKVLVQKFDRTVQVCLAPEQEDGWVDDVKGDYFQMPKEEKVQFLKDQILGINKTAETIVENCLKSKPRSYAEFEAEMKSCSTKHNDLSQLFENVITQNGEENKKNLYPVISQENRCYSRNVYKLVLEDRDVLSGRYAELEVKINLSKTPMLLSFEEDDVNFEISHNLVHGFSLKLVDSKLNAYAFSKSPTTVGTLNMTLIPSIRNVVLLNKNYLPKIFCSSKNNQIQIHGEDMSILKELLSTNSKAELRVNFVNVKGLFNMTTGSWGYATFTSPEVMKGVWFKPSQVVKFEADKNVKLVLSVGNSSYFNPNSKFERIIECN